MDVSKRIISLRERCGFTQNGLAERAGVSQTHLRRVELGQADITVGHLQLLCDAMGISLKEFFEDEHNKWLLLEHRIKELGYSYDEVKALKEHYRSEGAKWKNLEQEVSKELKLAETIRKDFVGTDGPEMERQQEEVKEQNMEHEKQPKR